MRQFENNFGFGTKKKGKEERENMKRKGDVVCEPADC